MPAETAPCSPARAWDRCPCAFGQSPSLGQGSLSPPLNRVWLSCERKGHGSHWKRAKRMSRWIVPISCWDRPVKRAPLFLESCVDITRDGQPRTPPSHRWSCSSSRIPARTPDAPMHHLVPVIYLMEENLTFPSPGLRGVTTRCASGFCLKGCG